MRYLLLLSLVASTGACAGYQRAAGISPDNPSTIAVSATLPPDSLQARAFAALTRAGFTISNQTPGLLTVGPYALREDPGVKLVLRVAVIPAAGGSEAVVSGVVVEDALGEEFGRIFAGRQGAQVSQGIPIREATTGRNARNWKEMTRAAGVIRADVAPPPG